MAHGLHPGSTSVPVDENFTTPKRPQPLCLQIVRMRRRATDSFRRIALIIAPLEASQYWGSPSGRKQQRLGWGLGGYAVKFGVVLPQRLGNPDLGLGEQVDELEGIDDGFALKVIVGYDVCGIAVPRDVANAGGPWVQLPFRVEVVVALRGRRGWVVAEPTVIPAAMHAHVGDAGRCALGRLHR